MIRKATANDLDFVYGLYMHPEINPWLLYEKMDLELFEPIYKELVSRDVKYIYEHEREEMGMCKLIPLTYRTSHIVYLGGLGIHPGFAGKGHGAKMMREIIDLSRTAGYKRIELSVSVENEKARHLYEKVGFEKEGVLRNYSFFASEGRYVDEVMMGLLL
ncbi:MAG: GNAT family N-acetyltransferase [Chitinophagaceae bacterium]|nr:GNAT family N-acetyltransferase [Chitinophagaceae bacterium]